MLSRLALVLAIVFLAAPVLAQSPARTVSGIVVDADSRAPIPNARLSVSQTVVATDAAGRFTLSVPVGLVTVLVEAAGYFPLATGLSVPEAGLSGAELALARDSGFATSVAVTAATPTAAPAVAVVAPVEVLRTPGALDNVYRTLQTLPGVAATEEFGSRLAVRGGSPDQNLTMMDGVEVHDPYRLFGLTSAFNPETMQRFELSTGGFSALYGDRLSSLLVVENRDGTRSEALAGSASLSITDANLVLEGRLPGKAVGSWLVTGRRTYYDLVAARITDQDFPAFADLQAKGVWEAAPGRKLTAFGLLSRQDAAVEIDEDDARGEFQDDTENDLAWLRFDTAIGTRGQSHTVAGYSDTRSTFGVDASFENTSRRSNAPREDSYGTSSVIFNRALTVRDLSLRQEFTFALNNHLVETGVEAHRLSTALRFEIEGDRNPGAANGSSAQGGAGLPDLLDSSQESTRSGAWIQDTFPVGSRASLQAGLRLDRPGATGETLFSPRLSASLGVGSATRLRALGRALHAEPGLREAGTERLRARLQRRVGAAQRTLDANVCRRGTRVAGQRDAEGRGLLQAVHRLADRAARNRGGAPGPRGTVRLSPQPAVRHPGRSAHHHRAVERRPRPILRLRFVRVAHEPASRREGERLGQLHVGPDDARCLRTAL